MKVHAPKVPKLLKVYNCPHCKKEFDRKFNLKVHVKTHTKIKEQQEFVCSICDKRFSLKKSPYMQMFYILVVQQCEYN